MQKKTGKSADTIYIMIVNIATSIISNICSLIVINRILLYMGSDYNGLNAISSQIINMLALVEGGFTLASQVALYAPVANKDINRINEIASYTSNTLYRLGVITFIIGCGLSIGYAFIIKSAIDYSTIVVVMMFAVVSTTFNVGVVGKYRLIFQVTQAEYKFGLAHIIITVLMNIIVFFTVAFTQDIIVVRSIYFVADIIKGFVIIRLARKQFKYLNFRTSTSNVQIKGTKDVFVAKFTALLYNSGPIIFISVFLGTMSTSVYAVYLSITNIVLNLVRVFITAPTHGIGQVIAESNASQSTINLKRVIGEYELSVILINCLLLSTAYVMIIPFVRLFTAGITDIVYIDHYYATIILLIALFEGIHMPSGICINVAGKFRVVKNIQIGASILLMFTMGVGIMLFGLKGMLLGKLITCIALAFSEIYYAYIYLFRVGIRPFLTLALPNYGLMTIICLIEQNLVDGFVISWSHWLMYGLATVFLNSGVLVLINLLFNRKVLTNLFSRGRRFLQK